MVGEDTGYYWQQERVAKAVVGMTEEVGSLASPDLVVGRRIALGDRRLRVSYLDGQRWTPQVEDRRESLELGDCLEELQAGQLFHQIYCM